MRKSSLRNAIKNVFLKEVDKQCSNLCARKSARPSVLNVPSGHHKSLVQFHWNNILKQKLNAVLLGVGSATKRVRQ